MGIKISQTDGQDDPDQEKEIAKNSQKGRKSGGRRKSSQNKHLATSKEVFIPSHDEDYYSNIKISQTDGQTTDDPDQEKEIAKNSQKKGRKSGGGRKSSQNKHLQAT